MTTETKNLIRCCGLVYKKLLIEVKHKYKKEMNQPNQKLHISFN